MRHGFKAWSEKVALEYRLKLSLRYYEHMDGFALADHLSIPVLFPSDFPELSTGLLVQNDWSAMTFHHPMDGNIIILNNTHSTKRQQSNIMHEIAHVVCNHLGNAFEIVDGLPILRKFSKDQEEEAEWLGGCLQLPRKALTWALNKGMNENEMSEYHSASMRMVTYRLRITGAKLQFSRYNTKKVKEEYAYCYCLFKMKEFFQH